MTLEAFSKLEIKSVIYNKNTNEVIIVNSQRSKDANLPKLTDGFSARAYGGENRANVMFSEHDDWEIVTNDAPDKVKLDICIVRLTLLENFVFSRMK